MDFISQALGYPLGYIMYACYSLLHTYGGAILLFALITKILFFPLSLAAQKNSIRLLKLQPTVNEIQARYGDDKNQLNEELYALYKREKYSPLKGSIPLLVQLPLILGVINVMYNPLRHILHLSTSLIDQISNGLQQALGIVLSDPGRQLRIIAVIQDTANHFAVEAMASSSSDLASALQRIAEIDLHFCGMDLGKVPSITQPSVLLFIPILSSISALILCLVQNALNPATKMQGSVSKWLTTLLLVAFSVYFTLVAPSGVGVYWICSNVLSILVAILLFFMYRSSMEFDVAGKTEKRKVTGPERRMARKQRVIMKKKALADYNRFMGQHNKELVVYSGTGGSYKYFQTILEYLEAHSDVVIHYVSSDPQDAILSRSSSQIKTYYADERRLISLMIKMDADIVMMTTPDLQKYHLKRSVVRKDIEYIYVFHAISSSNMVLREGAIDHYDTIFCEGPHKIDEVRKTEEVYGLPQKRLVKVGYSLMDLLLRAYEDMPKIERKKPQILVAPSWQIDNILDSCIDRVLEQLCGRGYKIVVRPHPEYTKRFAQRMEDIMSRHAHIPLDELEFDLDFSSNDTIYQSDMVITDWSNIAFEFSFCTKRPTVSINTAMKVMNPEYKRIGIEPINVTLRNVIGKGVDISELDQLGSIVDDIIARSDEYRQIIEDEMGNYLYYPGRSGEAGGRYIMKRLNRI